jgi:hypothetical protein
MSTPTTVQSNLIPFALSTDNVTYKNVVCKKAWNFKGTTPTSIEQTDCGPLTGIGSNEWSFDFQAVFNTAFAGATEMGLKEILTIWNNQTYSYAKVICPNPGGTQFFIQGAGYITSFDVANQVGNLITFNGTFSGNGAVNQS